MIIVMLTMLAAGLPGGHNLGHQSINHDLIIVNLTMLTAVLPGGWLQLLEEHLAGIVIVALLLSMSKCLQCLMVRLDRVS